MDTPEAAGWVLVLVADGAGCTRRVGEVRGGLGDVRETGFPPSDSQSSETRGWGGAWHSLETEPRTRRGYFPPIFQHSLNSVLSENALHDSSVCLCFCSFTAAVTHCPLLDFGL